MKNHFYCSGRILTMLLILSFGCQQDSEQEFGIQIDGTNLTYFLEIAAPKEKSEYVNYYVFDLDEDGESEIVINGKQDTEGFKSGDFLSVTNLNTQDVSDEKDFDGDLKTIKAIVNNQTDEIMLMASEQINDSVYIHVFDSNLKEINKLFIVRRPINIKGKWECDAAPIGMYDLDRDGTESLLLYVFTENAYQPRGIWIADLDSQKAEQFFPTNLKPTGVRIDDIAVYDVDKDGTKELFISNNAPNNSEDAGKVGYLDDCCSYFLIINCMGGIIDSSTAGEKKSHVKFYINDSNQNVNQKIIVLQWSRAEGSTGKSTISFYSYNKKRLIKKNHPPKQLHEYLLLYDCNADGIDEFLTFCSNGSIELRDTSNTVLPNYTFELGEQPKGEPLLLDLNGNGNDEIIVSTFSAVYVFSKDLKLLAKRNFENPVIQKLCFGKGEPEGIFVTTPTQWYQLKLKRNSAGIFRVSYPLAISFMAG